MNVLLLDPRENDLVAALEDAARTSGVEAEWPPLLGRVANEPQGRAQFLHCPSDTQIHYVGVIWWSDYRGRKHVRVAGGRDGHQPWVARHYGPFPDDPRPPLWHVCPERVYRVKRGDGEPVWLASCACGATGSPESLGWMGDRCGPCHDRAEDGEPHPAGPLVLIESGPTQSLTFAPTGLRVLLHSGADAQLLDLAEGHSTRLRADLGFHESGTWSFACTFSSDGRAVASVDPLDSGRVWVRDLASETDRVLDGNLYYPKWLAFSPGGQFLVCRYGYEELAVWHTSTWRVVKRRRLEGLMAAAFSADGRLLAARRGGVVALRPPFWAEAMSLDLGQDEWVYLMDVVGDVAVLATSQAQYVSTGTPSHLRLWDLKGSREIAKTEMRALADARLSPDGRYLAYRFSGPAETCHTVFHFWDISRWQQVGWVQWNPSDAGVEFAFSPCGEWLATGSLASVKLWPWRSLLGCNDE